MADGLFGHHSDSDALRDLKETSDAVLTTLCRMQARQERLMALVCGLLPHKLVVRLGTPVQQ